MAERCGCRLGTYIYAVGVPDHCVDTDVDGIFSRARSRRSARLRELQDPPAGSAERADLDSTVRRCRQR
jgi:hypothetical protein